MKYLLAAFALFACMGSADASWFEPSRPHAVRKAKQRPAKARVSHENRLGQHQQALDMLVARSNAQERELEALRAKHAQYDYLIFELKRQLTQRH